MAEGFAPAQLADGVYLHLPLASYLADPALSGSAFKKLLSDPAGLHWESEANPLWLRPEKRQDRARLRGSAAHCAILEGLAEYERRYTVKPADVLETKDDLKRWLSAKRQEFLAAALDGKLSKEDREAVKQTGEREDLVARVLALDPTVNIWDPDDGVDTLSPEDDRYVRLLERFVRSDAAFARLVSDGFPEVSIFWTEGDLRFKARVDYLTSHTVLDLKTFGQAPRRGRSLREHVVAEAAFNAYDLQAVHNTRAVRVAVERFGRLDGALGAKAVFRWLFLRMGGAPTGISVPFRESDPQWREAERQVAEACELYRRFRDAFGDELWLVTHGEQEIADTDWPLAAIRSAA